MAQNLWRRDNIRNWISSVGYWALVWRTMWTNKRINRTCPSGPSSWEFSSSICGTFPGDPSISYLIYYLNLNQRLLNSWIQPLGTTLLKSKDTLHYLVLRNLKSYIFSNIQLYFFIWKTTYQYIYYFLHYWMAYLY